MCILKWIIISESFFSITYYFELDKHKTDSLMTKYLSFCTLYRGVRELLHQYIFNVSSLWQISKHLMEAHEWFKGKFEKLQGELAESK